MRDTHLRKISVIDPGVGRVRATPSRVPIIHEQQNIFDGAITENKRNILQERNPEQFQ